VAVCRDRLGGVDGRYENDHTQVHGFATTAIDAAETVAAELGRDPAAALCESRDMTGICGFEASFLGRVNPMQGYQLTREGSEIPRGPPHSAPSGSDGGRSYRQIDGPDSVTALSI